MGNLKPLFAKQGNEREKERVPHMGILLNPLMLEMRTRRGNRDFPFEKKVR
jgi:hypothetical protein